MINIFPDYAFLGNGIVPSLAPNYTQLNYSDEEKKELESKKLVESFLAFSKEDGFTLDYNSSFNEEMEVSLRNLVEHGSVFIMIEYAKDENFRFQIKSLDPSFIDDKNEDNIGGDSNQNTISGIRFDGFKEVGLYIDGTYIEKYNENGLPNYIRFANPKGIDTIRGDSLLKPVLKEIKKLEAYEELIQNASSAIASVAGAIQGGKSSESSAIDGNEFAFDGVDGLPLEKNEDSKIPQINYKNGEVLFFHELPEGRSLNMTNLENSSPTSHIEYIAFQIQKIAGTLNIPPEVILMKFNKSYTASRGALNLFSLELSRLLKLFATKIYQPIFEIYVYLYKDEFKIPKYDSFFNQKAITNLSFFYDVNIDIDKNKSVSALRMELESGMKSIKQILRERGVNNIDEIYEEIVSQRNELLKNEGGS